MADNQLTLPQDPDIVEIKNHQAVTTSLVIADKMDLSHQAILKNIDKYSKELMELGQVGFEIRDGKTLPQGGKTPGTRYALLNEQQATFLISLSRNTPKVVQFKLALTKAFFEARRIIEASKRYTRETKEIRRWYAQEGYKYRERPCVDDFGFTEDRARQTLTFLEDIQYKRQIARDQIRALRSLGANDLYTLLDSILEGIMVVNMTIAPCCRARIGR